MKGRQISVKTLGQREELCMSKSTDLINAFTEHDNAEGCETTRSENTLKSDSILDSEVSSNSIIKNLSGKSGKLNKERVKTEVTKKEDLIREEKVIKGCRKRKRSTSDPQTEASLALKIVKASTLLNNNIPRASFTGSEKAAKESQDALTEFYKHYKSRSIHTYQSSVYPTASPEADIQTASSMPACVKALIINMPMELKKGYNQQLNSGINELFWAQSPLQRTLGRELCGIG